MRKRKRRKKGVMLDGEKEKETSVLYLKSQVFQIHPKKRKEGKATG